jgi:hypothetical protein
MQHADYRTTAKHYIDRKEIAKDMVKKVLIIYVEARKQLSNHLEEDMQRLLIFDDENPCLKDCKTYP